MALQIFFNDLSSRDAPAGRPAAVARLKAMTQVVRQANQDFRQLVFNGEDRLDDLNLGGDIFFAAVRNDPDCHDETVFLKTVVDRSPFAASIGALEGEVGEPFEYHLEPTAPVHPGAPAAGLGLSHRYTGLALSLDSHEFWRQARVTLDRTWLDEAGTLQGEKVEALNASAPEHLAAHAAPLRAALAPVVETGAALWEQRQALFPNLRFIPRTRQQLEALQAGDPVLTNVADALAGLDEAIGRWAQTGSAHPEYAFSVTPESNRRVALTAFNDQDGVERLFSDHRRFGPIEGRIHFILETQPTRHALIGHVGRKLGIG